MYDRGAVLCSACSAIFLLAETGLFNGKDTTVHFSYAQSFAAAFPNVAIHRRFATTTGLTPIAYVRRLRIEDAKRRLERTEASIDEISWQVGYEDATFFRRLFKRTTGLAPGAYRKRFRIPEFARP